ncbi:NACHT domain- and WD repeat-containing protein 1 [Hondaea fermentalgiana]|uniref:NACHT domain-and WD repeat-containing protein 1 n=1 Tax=Hondaea fermentalgiana TaxID=2315210 RepID=A0A2R5GIA9_9STRA|nr:NACHT domain- and WD repeat-containing protein 1 [Hondaea fermentalgiana]|eukprot:GBG28021.1 NACHT domain- and WD repeat-containing protein 1 [Hondaea fermentalgiana]
MGQKPSSSLSKALFGRQGAKALADVLAEVAKNHETHSSAEIDDQAADDPDLVQRVFTGHATTEDLKLAPEIVRSFMSSTFTDTRSERDCFVAFCVPLLRAHCRDAGYEFELSEMRWGINSDISAQHKTAEICIRELKRCLDTSAAMHFIGIVGDKYGFRPFPADIEQEEFEALLAHCDRQEDRDLLETWFVLDTNSVPAVYRLRPVYEVLPEYSAEVQNEASRVWWSECFEPMQRALRAAAQRLYGDDEEARRPYEASVTELEMRLGFTHPGTFSLLLSRHLDGDVKHSGYCDTVDGAQEHLAALREWTGEHASAASSTTLEWKEGGIDAVAHASHASYIRSTLELLCRMYAEQIADLPPRVSDLTILEEAKAHARFAQRKQKDFVGRTHLIERIADAAQTQPATLVSGISGSGKTALAAQVLTQLPSDFVLIVRFIGTTADSSSVDDLVRSVCDQICAVYGGESVSPDATFDELAEAFRDDFLARASAERPLCVVLDSLDQLPAGSSLAWLPHESEVPDHCHLLLTAMNSGNRRPLKRARVILQCPEIEVPIMRLDDIDLVLDTWLAQLDRRDSAEQRAFCKRVLDQAEEPTYLMLRTVFNQMTQWSSFTPLPENWNQVTDVVSLLAAFFEDLEQKHGVLFTQVALGFLTSARDGLSQPELEDLLSLHNEVLDSVFRWWVPPVPRIPPLVVTRLLSDLEPFLVRKTGNTKAWFHRQFREQAERRYASRHAELAAYFGNRASQQEFALDHKVNGDDIILSADRMILAQPPLIGLEEKPNVRVLRELVYQTRLGPPETKLDLLRVAFDFSFLQAAARGSALADVIDQIVLASEDPVFDESARRQLHVLTRCILLSLPSVSRQPGCLAEQLWNRLAVSTTSEDVHLFGLFKAVQSIHQRAVGEFTSLEPVLTSGDGDLKMSFVVHRKNPYFVRTIDADRFATGAADGELKIWEFRTGQLMQTLNRKADVGGATRFAVHRPVGSSASFLVSGFYGGCIRVWNADSGTMVGDIQDAHDHWVYMVSPVRSGIDDDEHTRHPLPLLVSGSKATDVKVWHIPALQGTDASGEPRLLHTLTDSTYGINCVDASYATEIAAPTSERAPVFVIAGSNTDVRVWRTDDVWNEPCTQIYVLGVGSKPFNGVHCFWRPETQRRYLAGACEDMCVHIWDLTDGTLLHRLQGHTSDLRGITVHTGGALTGDDSQLIVFSSSDDHTCRAWDLDTGSLLRVFDAHSRSCRTMALSCSRQSLVTVSFDNTACIWDVEPSTWARDQSMLAKSSKEKEVRASAKRDVVRKWAGKLASDAKGVAAYRAICLAQIGEVLVCGWTDGTVTLMHASGATETIRVSESATRSWVSGIASCSSGKGLAIVSHDGSLRILDLQVSASTGREFSLVMKICEDELNDIVVVPTSDTAAIAGEDWKIYLVDLKGENIIGTLKGHVGAVLRLSLSPTSESFLMSTGRDRGVRVWNIETQDLVVAHAKAHKDWVPACSFLSSTAAVTGSEDGGLLWWADVAAEDCEPVILRASQTHVGYTNVATAPDGERFIATLMDGSFEIWLYVANEVPTCFTTSLESIGRIDASPYVGQANCVLFLQQSKSRSSSKRLSLRRSRTLATRLNIAVAFHNSGIACFSLQP